MRRTLWLVLSVVAISASATTLSSQTPGLRAAREYFAKLQGGPYIFLETPRTNFGLGSVYTVIDRAEYYVKRPADCFPPSELVTASSDGQLRTFASNISNTYDLALGLKIAPVGPITEEAKAEFAKNNVQSLTISIPTLSHSAFTLDQARRLLTSHADEDCRTLLGSKRRWLIVETLSATNYSVTFNTKTGTKANFSAAFFQLLFPSIKFDAQKATEGHLEFSDSERPYIVAYKAIRMDKVQNFSSGQFGLVAVTPGDYATILERP